jgi:carbonic anhydrase
MDPSHLQTMIGQMNKQEPFVAVLSCADLRPQSTAASLSRDIDSDPE